MSEPSIPRRKEIGRYVGATAVLGLWAVGSFILFTHFARTNKALPELRVLTQQMPVYSQFRQTKLTESSGFDHASIVITYSVPAYTVEFEDVKRFYVHELTSRGWQQQPYRRKPLIDAGAIATAMSHSLKVIIGLPSSLTTGRTNMLWSIDARLVIDLRLVVKGPRHNKSLDASRDSVFLKKLL